MPRLTDQVIRKARVNSYSGEARWATVQFSQESGGPKQQIISKIVSSGREFLSLEAPTKLPLREPVAIEFNDILFLGEVVSCTQGVNESWHSEIAVETTLTSLQSVENLRASLMGEETQYSLVRTSADGSGKANNSLGRNALFR